jgi:hypothetical protein
MSGERGKTLGERGDRRPSTPVLLNDRVDDRLVSIPLRAAVHSTNVAHPPVFGSQHPKNCGIMIEIAGIAALDKAKPIL